MTTNKNETENGTLANQLVALEVGHLRDEQRKMVTDIQNLKEGFEVLTNGPFQNLKKWTVPPVQEPPLQAPRSGEASTSKDWWIVVWDGEKTGIAFDNRNEVGGAVHRLIGARRGFGLGCTFEFFHAVEVHDLVK